MTAPSTPTSDPTLPLASLADTPGSASVLDACCGSRMFWFDSEDPRAVFVDKREEEHWLKDSSSKWGGRNLIVSPDLIADFTSLPFPDESFPLVVFDPPHLVRIGKNSWMARKYGKLEGDWREELRQGFAECFRVLKPEGTLIFKWNEHQIAVSEILALTPEKPLFGNRCGKQAKSHWIVFSKPNTIVIRQTSCRPHRSSSGTTTASKASASKAAPPSCREPSSSSPST